MIATSPKPAFLSELAKAGSAFYDSTTPTQRALFVSAIVDLLKGKPTKLERFAQLEAETIAIKAAGRKR